MNRGPHMLPVWFFIGVLLAIYGVIIFFTSVVEFSHPAETVLSQYHAGFWGGILLLLIGGFYTFWFRPGRGKQK